MNSAATSHAPSQLIPLPASRSRSGLLLAWGDSWLGFVPFVMDEIRDCLVSWGYEVPEDYCRFGDWLTLEKMVKHRHEFKDDFLRRHLSRNPRAIILSAGGNDSVRDKLQKLLRPNGSGAVIDEGDLAEHISSLRRQFSILIDELQDCSGVVGQVPIIVHGYDHPVPSQRGTPTWIRTPFFNRGYVDRESPSDNRKCDLAVAQRTMRLLIDALNDMLGQLSQERENVRYVDLRGTISSMLPGDPASGWLDNMHPKVEGFRQMAAKIASSVEQR